MVSRDEWFAVHAPKTTVDRASASSAASGGGFQVDPEVAPAVRAHFEEAIQAMSQARRLATEFVVASGEEVNPVVDKYTTAVVELADKGDGSMMRAADSAVLVYQDVITQLNKVIASYHGIDEAAAADFGRQP